MNNNEYFSKVCELFGVELNEEFKMDWANARFRKNIYKITKNGLKVSENGNDWKFTNSAFNDITGDKVIKIPKRPKAGEKYYYPCPYKGWEENIWLDSDFDNRVLNKVGVFENQQKAYEKAREMGWF